MKSLLQVNLGSQSIDKTLYSIKRKSIIMRPYSSPSLDLLQKNSDSVAKEYAFDNICFNYTDINQAILYDLVMSVKNSKAYCKPLTLIFDQVSQSNLMFNFVEQLYKIDMFKTKQIDIAHFLIHNKNGLFDFHNSQQRLNADSDRNYVEKQNQENFMENFFKELNLCEEIRPYQINHIFDIVKYVSAQNFMSEHKNKIKEKTEKFQRQLKQIENRKITEFFVIKIGKILHLNFIILNYNKNYSLTPEEKKDITSIMTLYGSQTPEIKYKTIKTQIFSKFIKNSQKLYYITYFPGPAIQTLSLGCSIKNEASNNKWAEYPQIQRNDGSSLNSTRLQNWGKQSLLQTYGLKRQQTCNNLTNSFLAMNKKTQKFNESRLKSIKSHNTTEERALQYIQSLFSNYRLLKSCNKEDIQIIIKDYLQKKEEVAKLQLDRVNQSIKQLKIAHRIQECQVAELKFKTIKALEKMSLSIKQLQKMGIKNIGKHILWLQMTTEEKKSSIKEAEQQIEIINQRIVENQHKHEYFVKKMKQFRDKLLEKKANMKIVENHKKTQKTQPSIISIKTQQSENKENILFENAAKKLTQSQQEALETYKQGLRVKMNDRLRGCSQKKQFMKHMIEIKPKISKMQFSRLEQKYFELMVD